ncbi:hypothetical protein [Hornefia butyriciproducens]|uniref:hypothetical protein n=2 Tax=Hornefia butyriciproducens TaxID=2652293 RepID=UPI0023F3C5B6|nr:hypothetical protein [Hornefia butyriciproducens]MDD6298635.1 hypothetical protein [Hornefia butyriciproducens]
MLINGEEFGLEELPEPEDDDEPIDFESMTYEEIMEFLRVHDKLPQEVLDYIGPPIKEDCQERSIKP